MIKMRSLMVEDKAQIRKIAFETFSRISSKIHELFDDGDATCTYAVRELGKDLIKNNIPFKVISGEYEEGGHWWIETSDGTILDLGNNIKEESIESGKIRPIITGIGSGYDKESSMSYKQFLSFMGSLGRKK